MVHTQISGVDSVGMLGDLHVIENANGASIFDTASFGALKASNKRHYRLENLSPGYAVIDFTSSEFLPSDFKNGYEYAMLNLTGTILNAGTAYVIPMYVI